MRKRKRFIMDGYYRCSVIVPDEDSESGEAIHKYRLCGHTVAYDTGGNDICALYECEPGPCGGRSRIDCQPHEHLIDVIRNYYKKYDRMMKKLDEEEKNWR